MVDLCWLGPLGLPPGLPGATPEYRNYWRDGISMLAGVTGATSGPTWGYLLLLEFLGIWYIYTGWGYWGYLWGYLGQPLITGIPGDMVYL